MLAAASDQRTAQTGPKHQGRTTAGQRPAGDSPLTPLALPGTLAADPRYTLLRVPVVDTNHAPLMTKVVWEGVTTRDTPTRTTLFNAIRIQHLVGQLTAERAQWLAEHKNAPLLMWPAVEQSFACADPKSHLNQAQVAAFAQTMPVKAMTRFALNWQTHAPELVEPNLIELLVNLKRHLSGDTNTEVNLPALESALKATTNNVAEHLNRLIAQPTERHQPNESSAFSFIPTYDTEGNLICLPTEMMGIDLGLSPRELDNDTWSAIKLALDLIGKHLQPLETSLGINEYRDSYEMDEALDEMQAIGQYLKDTELDSTNPEHVEEAIAQTENFIIDCYDTWLHFADLIEDSEQVIECWTQPHEVTLDTLNRVIESLPQAQNGQTTLAQAWLKLAQTTLAEVTANHQCADYVTLLPELQYLDAQVSQPVFLATENGIQYFLQQLFEHRMSGEEAEGETLGWATDPRALVEQARRFGLGIHLLTELAQIDGQAAFGLD